MTSTEGAPPDIRIQTYYDDDWSAKEKIKFVLRVAQPFPPPPPQQQQPPAGGGGARLAARPYELLPPHFPFETVPTRAEAHRLIRAAAVQAFSMWDVNLVPDPDPERAGSWTRLEDDEAVFVEGHPLIHPPEAVLSWRDVWTHPEVYREVFSHWMGPVYTSRPATESVSRRAAEASRTGAPAPVVPTRTRGYLRTRERGTGGHDGVMRRYQHAAPERHGHRTRLVHYKQSPVAKDRFAELWSVQNLDDPTESGEAFPNWVVRLEDPGWYIGGFLPSVILWTYWAFRSRDARMGDAPLDAARPTEVDIEAIARKPTHFLGKELGTAWNVLHSLLGKGGFALHFPMPDIIRIPQEFLGAMMRLDPRDTLIYQLYVTGLGAEKRRAANLRALTRHDIGIPEWTEVLGFSEEVRRDPRTHVAEVVRVVRYLRRIEENHRAVLRTMWGTRGGHPRLSPPERYVPYPEPPNPLAAFYMPWSVLEPAPRPEDAGLFVERVPSLGPIVQLGLSDVAIPCLETGLALEEWGRSWSVSQREAPPLPSQRTINEAIERGAPVPGWEDEPRRELVLRHVMVLDPQGPVGKQDIEFEPFLHEEAPSDDLHMTPLAHGWPRSELERQSRAWLRPERMQTVESLTFYGAPLDSSVRWEDSGVEMPPRFDRPALVTRPLRFLQTQHNAVPFDAAHTERLWGIINQRRHRELGSHAGALRGGDKVMHMNRHRRALQMAEARRWRLVSVSPWPVILNAHWVDLRQAFRGDALSRAPVIRELSFSSSILPTVQWLGTLLEAAPRMGPKDRHTPPDEWLEHTGVTGQTPHAVLHPTARLTLKWVGLDRNATLAANPAGAYRAVLPAPSTFRPYPNLGLLSLHKNEFIDIPPALLDLATSMQSRSRRGVRPLPMMWDLSQNKIAHMSERTLVGLLRLLRGEAVLRGASRRLGEPENLQVTDTPLLINISGNPLSRLFEYERRTRVELELHLDEMKQLFTNSLRDSPVAVAKYAAPIERFVGMAEQWLDRHRTGSVPTMEEVMKHLGVSFGRDGEFGSPEAQALRPIAAFRNRLVRAMALYAVDHRDFGQLMERIEQEWRSDPILGAYPGGAGSVQQRILGFFSLERPGAFHKRMIAQKNAPHPHRGGGGLV